MNAIGSAFPLLTRRAGQQVNTGAAALSTRLCAVTQAGLPVLRSQLQDVLHESFVLADDGLHCTLSVGPDLSIPLTIVGTCAAHGGDDEYSGDDNIVVHSAGLPGGFVVSRQELLCSRARITPRAPGTSSVASAPQPSLGSVSLMEAVNAHFAREKRANRGVLDAFYTRARRRHFSLGGMAQLLHRGSQLHLDALLLNFPYHCGAAHATKRYLDITPEVTNVFGAQMRHGAKVLSRYGIAVGVGVVDRMSSMQSPAMLWHPSGAPAACLAPLLHGCALLSVGTVSLDYNGPVPGSALTQREDPRRYMKLTSQGCYDDSVWLTEGLFGVKPGSAWPPVSEEGASRAAGPSPPSHEVVGVGYNEEIAEMELLIRDGFTGEVVAAADV
ncbi:hypothetical protein ABB37_03018 [Leptomonas pyrrhocoris]|uniref:Uncharacterized protein n=1 Tax=Leptomonas pyrrhocoris TaxID=157538 RepID=A0A0N0DXU9_LEPPY|nr:hypothetical protein ABB37_03018 [Leptomonas pyrrhocoris]KPA83372.1 hypothetical protein ABB37_03018 [Leptomonas pyrrhocoris]|eukprot:XP_015661811.1 hypothetical protein ABB37_03018 [Leptomonas pyrrhocoris]